MADGNHSHGNGFELAEEAKAILKRGLGELLKITEGLEFQPMPSERHPFPLSGLAYPDLPDPKIIRADVEARMHTDPVSVLEKALALLELYESNQADIAEFVPEDMPFVGRCFSSKRCNGWACVVGDADAAEIESAVNARWQFQFINGRGAETGIYAILNMLGRYAYVYGSIEYGDGHALAHFVEDFCPGVLICRGTMSDLQLTLSLAALKMGVPAVVPTDYPFPLGRTLRADSVEDIAEAVAGFANIRRLLSVPGMIQMPDYCRPDNRAEEFVPAATWGGTDRSFYIVRKGQVEKTGWSIVGKPGRDIGVVVTIDAEPMDAFDCDYIERNIINSLNMVRGVAVNCDGERFEIRMARDTELAAERVGEVLAAAVRHEFPKLTKVRVEIVFDAERLEVTLPDVKKEKRRREEEMRSATEETAGHFFACVGCSPFAPDHVCCVTPERGPQCNRPYGMIKTGALYGYDDMSNIHHSRLQRDINSFQVAEKGRCLDADTGEWEGLNAKVAELSQGRTRRVQLHSLDEAPHTGCGCFRLIMFKTEGPRPGIAIMSAGYGGRAPDGRSWSDLHYALTGKQTPGMAGASPPYLFSARFLKAHGGWKSVVWVSPQIAEAMGEKLPPHVEVGEANCDG
ncbi:MAG: hypothetical protein QGD94_00670 [Planctomycetia bacterium]|nr:hypothetical protein [Planctomycetia bacterium]